MQSKVRADPQPQVKQSEAGENDRGNSGKAASKTIFNKKVQK